jgi:hypothetical protein
MAQLRVDLRRFRNAKTGKIPIPVVPFVCAGPKADQIACALGVCASVPQGRRTVKTEPLPRLAHHGHAQAHMQSADHDGERVVSVDICSLR